MSGNSKINQKAVQACLLASHVINDLLILFLWLKFSVDVDANFDAFRSWHSKYVSQINVFDLQKKAQTVQWYGRGLESSIN
jgi:hypothetical protein